MLVGLGHNDDGLCSIVDLNNLVGHEINSRLSQWRLCRLRGSLASEEVAP